jgi:hypothetical protein
MRLVVAKVRRLVFLDMLRGKPHIEKFYSARKTDLCGKKLCGPASDRLGVSPYVKDMPWITRPPSLQKMVYNHLEEEHHLYKHLEEEHLI